MGKSQPQYLIEALSTCKTHRPGTQITYTGSRAAIPKGWRLIRRL